MAKRTDRMQAAIAREGASAGMSLEWDLADDPRAAWEALQALDPSGAVIGIGMPWAQATGARIPGLAAFQRKQGGDIVMPATQHALWAYVPGDTPGAVFAQAEKLTSALGAAFRLAESTALLRYRDGRDLLGYRDGTENPKGDAAWDAALVPDGAGVDDTLAGGSFAFVQRYVHARPRFFKLAQAERDNVIGRTEAADVELEDAPDTAHVKRTAQEDFDPPAFMLRRSMPWGDPLRHGLVFVAFVAELDRVERQLNRMLGLTDGVRDALLGFTQAETGAYYFCPPVADGRLALPAFAG
jgi:putative iron-dependent peroxidase